MIGAQFWPWFAQSHLPWQLGCFFGGLLVFHLLERRAPVVPHHTGPARRGYLADITATLVDGPFLAGLTKIVAYYLIVKVPAVWGLLASWNVWWQFALFFVVNDFMRYWLHRWYHESDLLWRIHRVHHTVCEMDAMSTFRVHVFEGIIKYGVIILPFQLFGIDRDVVLVYSCIDILKGFWHHANLRTYIGPLNYVLNSAELHWWHHSIEGRGQRSNYGSTLSIWDWLFGTAYWPKGQWPEQIGVEAMQAFPDDYLRQFASVRFTDDEVRRAYPAGAADRAGRADGISCTDRAESAARSELGNRSSAASGADGATHSDFAAGTPVAENSADGAESPALASR